MHDHTYYCPDHGPFMIRFHLSRIPPTTYACPFTGGGDVACGRESPWMSGFGK